MTKNQLSQQIRQIIYGTLPHFMNGFLVERRSRGVVKGTLTYYQDELERFITFMDALGIIQLEEVTPDLIRRYLLFLGETRNTGGIHAAFRAVRAFFNWYEGEFEPEGWKNPIHKVKPPQPGKDPLPGLQLGDFRKLLSACSGQHAQRDKTILLFLLDTGCRAAELCALNVGDVDLVTGSVIIEHGKGDKRRVVFVGQVMLRELRRYLKSREALQPAAPLFVNDENHRVKFGGVRALVNRLAKRANIRAPGLHDFRRAFAVSMLRNGVDVVTLSRLMGHTTLEVTKRYLFQVNDDLRSAHQKGSPIDNLSKGL